MLSPLIRIISVCLACMGVITLSTAAGHAETIRIGGTGMALAAMRSIGETLTTAEPSLHIEVLPSLGTSGGIKALIAGEIDIALTGRALKPEEQAKGITEAVCMTTTLVFVSSRQTPTGITKAEIPDLYADPAPNWPDGMPLKAILRPRTGAEVPYLVATMPELAAAFDKAYDRQDSLIAITDQENADLVREIPGSIAIMTQLQIQAERLTLTPLSLDGVAPAVETLANKTYPFSLRVCAVVAAVPSPAVAQFIANLKSPVGQALLRSFGAAPAD